MIRLEVWFPQSYLSHATQKSVCVCVCLKHKTSPPHPPLFSYLVFINGGKADDSADQGSEVEHHMSRDALDAFVSCYNVPEAQRSLHCFCHKQNVTKAHTNGVEREEGRVEKRYGQHHAYEHGETT